MYHTSSKSHTYDFTYVHLEPPTPHLTRTPSYQADRDTAACDAVRSWRLASTGLCVLPWWPWDTLPHCPAPHASIFLGSSWLARSSPWPRQLWSPLPQVKTAPSGVRARLWSHPVDTATTRCSAKASTCFGSIAATAGRRGPACHRLLHPSSRRRRRRRGRGCGTIQPTRRRRAAQPRPRSSSAAAGADGRRGPTCQRLHSLRGV